MRVLRILVAVGAMVVLGCAGASQPPMPWSSKPLPEWPQLVLTNEAHFAGDRSLYGASAFLIQNEADVLVVATARHLIGAQGGIDPPVRPQEVGDALRSWAVFVRNVASPGVLLASDVAAIGLQDINLDWLILRPERGASSLPSAPLRMRTRPLKVGEEVLLVGIPYSEKSKTQSIYSGRVTELGPRGLFRYSIDPPVDLRGFSGAPVVDRSGLLVGVTTVWFKPRMSGENFLESGGQSVLEIAGAVDSLR